MNFELWWHENKHSIIVDGVKNRIIRHAAKAAWAASANHHENEQAAKADAQPEPCFTCGGTDLKITCNECGAWDHTA